MNPAFFILSLLFQWVMTTSAISPSQQLVATSARGGYGNSGVMCIDNERNALLDFKSHVVYDRYGFLSTWVAEEKDCCLWSQLECDSQTGHVTDLLLSDGGLQGEISPSLINLTHLTYLELFDNSFHGTILGSIGSLTELRYVYLSGNSFNETIPESIGSLTQLRDLDLHDNYFHGTIPSSIGSLTELRKLSLSNNPFNGTIPLEIGNLTNLQFLGLGSIKSITTENLDWLSHLSRLEFLDMSGISLAKVDNWVNVIQSLQNLSILDLSGCELSQVIHPYSSFSAVNSSSSNIESLNLGNNNLNSSMSHWLFRLTSNNSLLYLDLSNNKLDGIPKYLGNLCSLQSLDLNGNSVDAIFSDFLNNLSGCTSLTLQRLKAFGSQFTGALSDEIQKFSSLNTLYLYDNKLNGTISEKLWELPRLQILDLSSNSLRGPITQNIGNSRILTLDLSNNSLLEGFPSKSHISNLSYIEYIDLSNCKLLGPHFPKWIQNLKNLSILNIANTMISDTIPTEFWNMWPSQLNYLNLSSNNITGKVSDLISNFKSKSSHIDLSYNDFYGPISNVSSSVETLDLSRNRFSGRISFLCEIDVGVLIYLDLSNNLLTGHIPECLWHFENLKVLNLGHNNLFGRLPGPVKSMFNLEGLYLNNNILSGELPLFCKNCTQLSFLNLGTNRFSGILPHWIGENLPMLYVIILSNNNFSGSIPLGLCLLVNLRILDLSMNNLNGTIPSCVSNLTAMVQDGFLHHQEVHKWYIAHATRIGRSEPSVGTYIDNAMINWKGNVREFSITLGLLKIIDLSSNNLTGQIPYEIVDMNQLFALNLSRNSLQGKIPQNIGQMKQLQVLDLSRNNLSGELPSNISLINFLNDLDVSHNNLSGRIPSGTQLQSFEPSKYIGNAGLCGPPMTKKCPGDEEIQEPPIVDGEDKYEVERWFYIGGASGFVTGFWIACSFLFLNRRMRHVFFSFLNNLRDWVYVKVMVFIAKFERVEHA